MLISSRRIWYGAFSNSELFLETLLYFPAKLRFGYTKKRLGRFCWGIPRNLTSWLNYDVLTWLRKNEFWNLDSSGISLKQTPLVQSLFHWDAHFIESLLSKKSNTEAIVASPLERFHTNTFWKYLGKFYGTKRLGRHQDRTCGEKMREFLHLLQKIINLWKV